MIILKECERLDLVADEQDFGKGIMVMYQKRFYNTAAGRWTCISDHEQRPLYPHLRDEVKDNMADAESKLAEMKAIFTGKAVEVPTPTPPAPTKPTLRKGSSGQYVTLLQTELINRGYSCGASGADGKFGNGTLAAVKAFQADHGLTVDGIVGPATWAALDSAEPTIFYTVTVPHLTQAAANQLLTNYPGSTMTQE